MKVQTLNSDPRDVIAAIENIFTQQKGPENAVQRGAEISGIWQRERERLIPVLNATTITISADLKRVAVLNETVTAFAQRVLALRLFSTSFQSVALEGTDEAVVPYFPLQTQASTDWNAANGYVFGGANEASSKKITVDKRKYQPLDYSSQDFQRQPFTNFAELSRQNGMKLGYDVLIDILGVITAAKFGATAKELAPAAWGSDDVIDLGGIADDAMWPEEGRALIVNSAVNTALQKDDAYKLALNIGGTEVIREGQFPRISGFNYATLPGFPTNDEKLIGCIAHPSAVLIAFAPVQPTADVRKLLSAYEVVTHVDTGITLTYKRWGNPQMDRSNEIIESSYGFEAGEAAALKRLTQP